MGPWGLSCCRWRGDADPAMTLARSLSSYAKRALKVRNRKMDAWMTALNDSILRNNLSFVSPHLVVILGRHCANGSCRICWKKRGHKWRVGSQISNLKYEHPVKANGLWTIMKERARASELESPHANAEQLLVLAVIGATGRWSIDQDRLDQRVASRVQGVSLIHAKSMQNPWGLLIWPRR